MDSEYDMTDLMTMVVSERAEGLGISPGQPPAVHLRGEVQHIEGPAVSAGNSSALLRAIADTRQMRELHENSKAEFLFTFRESRFRVTAKREHEEIHFQILTMD